MLLYPNDRLMEFFSLANKLESQKFNFSDPRSKEYIVHTTKLELFCIVICANQKRCDLLGHSRLLLNNFTYNIMLTDTI